ncbi:MAG: SAVED domain-containing protein [Candidatus Eremiobacterota bacterium]
MARCIVARQKGDSYQALFFWRKLIKLRINDYFKSVTLDSDKISFVDDIIVEYIKPRNEKSTNKKILHDYYQCKCHMTQSDAFRYENLIDPDFIHSKQSMLQRLHNAYLKLINETNEFLLHVVSNWFWHPDDPIAMHLSDDRIRDTFYRNGRKEKKVIKVFTNHLSISEVELENFLSSIRFDLGTNLPKLVNELESDLKYASLRPIEPDTATIFYDDLAWKLFEQGRNHFTKESFEQMLKEENLIVMSEKNYSEISICSRPQYAHRPRDIQADYLDLTSYFDERYPITESYWQKEIPESIDSFLKKETIKNLPPPIHIFFDCHLSIAFLVGSLLDPKFGLQIVPAHKTRTNSYEFWYDTENLKHSLWKSNINSTEKINTDEVIIEISITNPVENHLIPFLKAKGLDKLPILSFEPINGIGQKAICNGEHAWQLGMELQTILRSSFTSKCQKMHLFFSCPAAFAYILGNNLRHVTKIIQLYEHDFEGSKYDLRYYPSIIISDKIN